MAGVFDATLKQLLHACASDWVRWLAPLVGLPATVTAEPLDADLSTVQPTADKVFRLQPPGSGLLHIEPQSSWDGGFPERLLLYNVLLESRYGGPVHTAAMLLRREANSPGQTGTVVRQFADGREYLRFGYAVVRVWELSAAALMAGGLGAVPLALLTDDAEAQLPALVAQFAARVTREAPTADTANLLLSCGYILLGLRYDNAVARTLFHGVQKMRESSTYQAILEEGRDEGRNEAAQLFVLRLGTKSFGPTAAAIEAAVRSINDFDRLKRMTDRLLDAKATGWEDLLDTN
jgi:predicted transposase YdaD